MSLRLTFPGRAGPRPGVSREPCPGGVVRSQVGGPSFQGTLASPLMTMPTRTVLQMHPAGNMFSGWHTRGEQATQSSSWVSTSLWRATTTRTARQVSHLLNTVSGWHTRNQRQRVGTPATTHVNRPTRILMLGPGFPVVVSDVHTRSQEASKLALTRLRHLRGAK